MKFRPFTTAAQFCGAVTLPCPRTGGDDDTNRTKQSIGKLKHRKTKTPPIPPTRLSGSAAEERKGSISASQLAIGLTGAGAVPHCQIATWLVHIIPDFSQRAPKIKGHWAFAS